MVLQKAPNHTYQQLHLLNNGENILLIQQVVRLQIRIQQVIAYIRLNPLSVIFNVEISILSMMSLKIVGTVNIVQITPFQPQVETV